MLVDCPRFPSWTVHYGAAVAALQRAWETGELSSRELAAAVASRLGAGNRPEDVSAYMGELCRSVRFFPVVNAALRRRRDRGDRQALVTVNPDLFADIA